MYTSLLNYPIMYQVNAESSPSFHLEADLFLRNKPLEYFDEPVWFSLFGRYFVTKKNCWAFFPKNHGICKRLRLEKQRVRSENGDHYNTMLSA